MNSQIICFEDITAINSQRFYKTFLSRLKAQNIIIKEIDLIEMTKQSMKALNTNFDFETKQFYLAYLRSVYLFLSTLEQNTCYIINNTPLLLNLFQYVSEENTQLIEYAQKILNCFSELLSDILIYINITSFTEYTKNILEDKTTYKKYIYDKMISDYSNMTQKIDTIQKLKQILQKNIVQFRKRNITSIKLDINFNEDINNGIQKIFKTLNIN